MSKIMITMNQIDDRPPPFFCWPVVLTGCDGPPPEAVVDGLSLAFLGIADLSAVAGFLAAAAAPSVPVSLVFCTCGFFSVFCCFDGCVLAAWCFVCARQ